MATNNCPKRVWEYALVYEARILSIIARGKDDVPGLEKITGDTVDITEYLDFAFWDLVWFGDDLKNGPALGRWLGVLHRIGSALCYYIIKSQHVTRNNFALPGTAERIKVFDTALADRLKDYNFGITEGEALISKDEDMEEYDNDNINYLEPSEKNMMHMMRYSWLN